MSKRTNWIFLFTAGEIKAGVDRKHEYHLDRLEWWYEERSKAEQAIKDAGIQTRTHDYTGGDRIEVIIDATLGKRLAECNDKLKEHEVKLEDYKRWAATLGAQETTMQLQLDIADVEYFGLGEED